MNNNIFYSADYKTENSIGLFDRIINIRFFRKNGESFTLRSDYEPEWHGGKLYFRTCQPKPEIRVTYTQYQATMINVDIYVTNLNILDSAKIKTSSGSLKEGARVIGLSNTNLPNESLTSQGDKRIVKAEIEMGYRGQFFNWAAYRGDITSDVQNYESFLNLERPNDGVTAAWFAQSQTFFRADLRKCTVMIEWAANTSNPPDRITQFHGFVGSTEAGLQPFSLAALDSVFPDSGDSGQITKEEIFLGLNDTYSTIDEVLVESLKVEGSPFETVFSSGGTAYRNFFNGGRGFTLLEGYCFQLFTRRFIRADIAVKEHKDLSQAAFDYLYAIEYPEFENPLKEIKERITQTIYAREREFYKDYFTPPPEAGSDTVPEPIMPTDAMPKRFLAKLQKEVNDILVKNYIGSRFTIKNLPEYRKLYNLIRERLQIAALKGEYKLWWEAAEELAEKKLEGAKPNEEQRIDSSLSSLREYVLKMEKGDFSRKDCYIGSILGKDWILPVQNIEGAPLRNSSGKIITFRPPSAVSISGFTGSGPETAVKCFSGLLEVRDAYMFGLPVLCSDKASKNFQSKHAGKSLINLQFKLTPQAQIEWLCKEWNLQYYKFHNGGYYIYDPSENARGTAGQNFVTSQSNRPFRIPAIYDITLDPMRKLRMPFIAFLNPMSIVEWNSTATIGSMISFYYQPSKGRNFFMVIKNSIDFSTVGDQNMMQIDLVDTEYTDKSEIPSSVIRQEKKNVFVETLIIPDAQTDTWRKIYESPVGTIPMNLREAWGIDPEVPAKNLSPDNRVSAEQFFLLMESWNPGLFNLAKGAEEGWGWSDSKKRIDKTANKLYGSLRPEHMNFPDIEYCLPKLFDTEQRIYMKFPFMPNASFYSQMEVADPKYIMVYESGIWEMRLKTEMSKRYTIGAF